MMALSSPHNDELTIWSIDEDPISDTQLRRNAKFSAAKALEDYGTAIEEARFGIEALKIISSLPSDTNSDSVAAFYRDLENALKDDDGNARRLLKNVLQDAENEQLMLRDDLKKAARRRAAAIELEEQKAENVFYYMPYFEFCSWFLAIAGIAIALGFLSKNFFNPIDVIDVAEAAKERIELPLLTVCHFQAFFPSFYNLPSRRYRGSPIFTLNRLYHKSARLRLQFPATLDFVNASSQTAEGVDPGGRCDRALSRMDPAIHKPLLSSSYNVTKYDCHQCLTIGQRGAVDLRRDVLNDALRMEFATNRAFSLCFLPETRVALLHVKHLLYRELTEHFDDLVKMDILDLNGADPNRRDKFRNIRNNKYYPQGTRPDIFVFDKPYLFFDQELDFLCGVYFFSGFFYPSVYNKMSWIYNKTDEWWHPKEKGKVYFKAGLDPLSPLLRGPNLFVGRNERDLIHHDVRVPFEHQLNIYVSLSQRNQSVSLNNSVRVTSLVAEASAELVLRRSQILETTEYNPQAVSLSRFKSYRLSHNFNNHGFFRSRLGVSFDSFREEVHIRRTYKTAAFLADAVNVFGIFTGLNVGGVLIYIFEVVASRIRWHRL